ncbi:MAG: anthranilate phosphoribosyltransferase [Simkaniaceae bacterium]|nr:anthranilate phosphoribosyltransferase [Simkaniaceae bacterium]
MLKEILETILQGRSLNTDECSIAMEEVLSGENDVFTAAFLALMRAKGETAEELFRIIRIVREKSRPLVLSPPFIDIVGTGGDDSGSVNISTGAALVVASAGMRVAKHGNRAFSSAAGSADVLEALGIAIEISPEKAVETIEKLGIVFLFAPLYHPAFAKVARVRKLLGFRTLFNLLGPLLHPADPPFALLGTASEEMMDRYADLLLLLGVKRAMVVHSSGMDELTPVGPCDIVEVREGKKVRVILDPADLGMKRCDREALKGGDAGRNGELLLEALAGGEGPIGDALDLNAAAALCTAEVVSTMKEGVERARNARRGGKAIALVERWKTF